MLETTKSQKGHAVVGILITLSASLSRQWNGKVNRHDSEPGTQDWCCLGKLSNLAGLPLCIKGYIFMLTEDTCSLEDFMSSLYWTTLPLIIAMTCFKIMFKTNPCHFTICNIICTYLTHFYSLHPHQDFQILIRNEKTVLKMCTKHIISKAKTAGSYKMKTTQSCAFDVQLVQNKKFQGMGNF